MFWGDSDVEEKGEVGMNRTNSKPMTIHVTVKFFDFDETLLVSFVASDNIEMADQHISAKYRSQKSSEAFAQKLPTLPKENDAKTKMEYLSALRSSLVQMQSDVNVFLTKKMEEEKSSNAYKGDSRKSLEEKEEEMYGEEDPEAEG